MPEHPRGIDDLAANWAEAGEADVLANQAAARLSYRARHAGKVCTSCHKLKPLTAFGPGPSRADGLAYRCRECDNERKRSARRASPH